MASFRSQHSIWHACKAIQEISVFQGGHVEHMIMQPHPLYPLFFSERIAEIDPALSAELYEDLQEAGFINSTGYSDYLTYPLPDPAEDKARECVLELCYPICHKLRVALQLLAPFNGVSLGQVTKTLLALAGTLRGTNWTLFW